jgi:beta-xylosidase
VEPGEFEIMIGRSSADILFSETVEVTGKLRELPAKWRMKTEVSAASA